jgi:sulfur-carrier protein
MKILYLARLREALGQSEETLSSLENIRTVDDLLAHLRGRGGAYATELAAGRRYRVAVNHAVVDGSAALAAGDEVAIFPPVTGG